MKIKHTLTALAVMSLSAHAATTTWNGASALSTTDVDNWTTSDVAFDDTVQSGHSMNWENVVVNTSVVDSANNEFDNNWEAGANFTIGRLYMYNGAFDLSNTTGGIEDLAFTADFNASAYANWSAVVAISNGGSTRYYRWNHSGNSFNGNGAIDFSIGDTVQLEGNAVWGELNATSSDFAATRDDAINPDLQATTGTFSVGFIQWNASSSGSNANTDFTTSIDAFDVTIESTLVPEPSSTALLGLGGLALLMRRRK